VIILIITSGVVLYWHSYDFTASARFMC